MAHGQQVRLGGADAGAPDDRRHVDPFLSVGQGEGALDLAGVGEAEDGLAGRGDEALGRDVGGQRGEGDDGELVSLLVPGEAVLAAPPGLRGEQLLDPRAGRGLAVREVGGVADHEVADASGVVELVGRVGLLPFPAVRVQRRRVLGAGEVRHQGLVQRLEPLGLGLVGPLGRRRGAVAAVPGRCRHHGDDGEQRPVRHQGHDQDHGRHEEQQWPPFVLGRVRPPAPAGRGQQAQPARHGDQRMEDVGGAVGRRPGQLLAPGDLRPGDLGAVLAQNAGERAPGHCCLLMVRAGGTGGVRT